ncbi:MAG: DUF4251 domain-containing protein [Bacteroidota bacterium]
MRWVVVFLLLISGMGQVQAREIQKDTLSRKEARSRKKAEQEKELQRQFEALNQVLLARSFVLEADFVERKTGLRFRVNRVLNFVMVDSAEATIQVGADNRLGFNGAGGVTDKGKISGYKLTRNDKNRSFFLKMAVRSSLSAHVDIFLDIDAYGTANAVVSGGIFGQYFRFDGRLVPLDESGVYRGQSP